MRIIFVAPHSFKAVGYESQTEFIKSAEYHHEVCRELLERGHDVEFWHLGPFTKERRHDYGHKIRQLKTYIHRNFGREFSPTLYRELVRDQADIIHIHGLHMESHLPIYLLCRLSKKQLVVQNHGPALTPHQPLGFIWYSLLSLILSSRSDVLSVNHDELENLNQFSIGRKREYIPNGVNTEQYSPMSRIKACDRLALDPSAEYVLFVGRLTKSKGVKYLINAMEEVSAELLIVFIGGDDNIEQSLRCQAKNTDASIDFVGSVRSTDLVHYYNAANVCAFPSVSEGFGVVLLESMACGTPTVGTTAHQAGQGHLQHQETGLVAESESSTSLAKEINRVLNDSEFADKLGANGRELVVENYGWKAVVDQLLEIYSEG